MCRDGLVWTTMPPEVVVIMEVLTFWRACVLPTIMMDWPAAFLPWWKTGMEVGTSGGGTGVLDRLIVGSILVTLIDCCVGTNDGIGMLVGPLVSVMLLLFRMIWWGGGCCLTTLVLIWLGCVIDTLVCGGNVDPIGMMEVAGLADWIPPFTDCCWWSCPLLVIVIDMEELPAALLTIVLPV